MTNTDLDDLRREAERLGYDRVEEYSAAGTLVAWRCAGMVKKLAWPDAEAEALRWLLAQPEAVARRALADREYTRAKALPEIHPADCQSCCEDIGPCITHIEDYRYWQSISRDLLSWGKKEYERGLADGLVDGSVPRHLLIALARAQEAFERDNLRGLASINEDLQQLVDAAIAWGHRLTKAGGSRE